MSTEWIVIEVMAIFIEGITKVYFLNNRYASKFKSMLPQLVAVFCLFGWGIIGTFFDFPSFLYDGINIVIILAYLLWMKYGTFGQKLFGLILTHAISIGSSLAGAGLASILTNVSMEHTMLYQDSSRLLAIILIKTIEIVLFYGLAKRHYRLQTLQKKPAIVLTCAVIMIFLCFLFMFINLSSFNVQANQTLIWLAAGLLFILIGVFVMYEMFIQEETRNISLSTRLQRLEMESKFFKELDIMQADLRTWRHEYKNNLLALRALIEEGSIAKTLEYLNKISGETSQERTMLQSSNPVLDAVVSTKLMLARSYDIEVSIHVVYPEVNNIDDNDLCAIIGNLLDNAIEACERMSKKEKPRFISFSLLIKGKNLVISILNSYDGEIRRSGERYLTVKNGPLHGIGIQYTDSIVEKYQGHVLRTCQDGVFETHVMLPLISV